MKERNTKTGIELVTVLLRFMLEQKDADRVHDAQLTMRNSRPESLLHNLVLSTALCISRDTEEQPDSSYFTVTKVKLEKDYAEIQKTPSREKK